MALDLKPHQYRRVPNTDQAVLTALNPYCRLSKEGETPVFIQGGRFVDASGVEISPIPEWVLEEVKKMTSRARGSVGLRDPEPPKVAPSSEEEDDD